MMDVRVYGAMVKIIVVSLALFRAETLPFGKEELKPPHADVEFAIGEVHADTPAIEQGFKQSLEEVFEELGTQRPRIYGAFSS